jgi:dephospho-CoA kinase
MIIIGIIGPKRAGKDTIAKHIARKYNGKNHSHSEILYRILEIMHLEPSRENAIRLVQLRKVFGENILVQALNTKIERDHAELEAITGIRFQNEFDNIRSYPQNKIIFVDAPLETRFRWQHEDGEKSDDETMSFVEFIEMEKRETEIHIKELGKQADYHIENNGTQAQLFEQVDKIMAEVLKEYGKTN